MSTAPAALSSPSSLSWSAAPSLALRLPFPVLVGAFCLLWASAFSIGKLAMGDCPPLFVLAARFLIAGVVVMGTAIICAVPLKLSRRDILVFAALGVANQSVYLGVGYVAMKSIS